MIGLVAIAFVAGSIMTGTMAEATGDKKGKPFEALWTAIHDLQESGVGEQGLKGDQGIQGIQGESGIDGIDGTNGIDGIQGETGPQGPSGIIDPTFEERISYLESLIPRADQYAGIWQMDTAIFSTCATMGSSLSTDEFTLTHIEEDLYSIHIVTDGILNGSIVNHITVTQQVTIVNGMLSLAYSDTVTNLYDLDITFDSSSTGEITADINLRGITCTQINTDSSISKIA